MRCLQGWAAATGGGRQEFRQGGRYGALSAQNMVTTCVCRSFPKPCAPENKDVALAAGGVCVDHGRDLQAERSKDLCPGTYVAR